MRLRLDGGAPAPSEDAVFIAGNPIANANARALGANVESRRQFGGPIHRTSCEPLRAVRIYGVEAVDGADRIVQRFDFSDTTAQGYWVGAAARVYRLGETVDLVRETTVAAHASSFWVEKRTVAATTIVHNFDTYNRRSAPQWFAVRAYDAAGNVGPLSNVVTITTPETWPGTGVTPTADTNKTLYGETGALGAAVISIAAGWPTNRGVTITVDTPASGSVAGYVLYMSDHDPANHLGSYIDLTPGGAAVQVGDMLILDHSVDVPKGANRTNRVFNANRQGPERDSYGFGWAGTDGGPFQYRLHDGGGYTGHRRKYLELTVGEGETREFRRFNFPGTASPVADRDAYELLRPGLTYRFETWARSDAPRTLNPRVSRASTITAVNDAPSSVGVNEVQWNVTTTWQKFSFEFQVSAVSTGSALGSFSFDLPGPARYDFSDITLAEKADGGPGRLSPDKIAFYQAANLRFIRDHRIVKTHGFFEGAYDLRELILDWLHNSLSNSVAAGIPEVWIQPEFYLSDAEALGLVEYMCAPDGTGEWTALRAALGRTGPWVDAFDRVFWELSNETWQSGQLDAFSRFPNSSAEWYGKFQERYITRAKASPHWSTAAEQKVDFVLGGWAAQQANVYNSSPPLLSPSSEWISYAPYLGGWDMGGTLPAESTRTYWNLLMYGVWIAIGYSAEFLANAATAAATRGAPLRIATYENGLGYELPAGQDNVPYDRTAKSRAGGAGVLDKYLIETAGGFEAHAHFRVERGSFWASHQLEGTGNAPYPDWQWMELFNRECAGAMRDVFRIKCPQREFSTTSGGTVTVLDEIGCHVLSNGTRRTVVLVNRNLPWDAIDSEDDLYDAADDGARTVRVKIPWASATSVTRHHMNGDYDSQNFDPAAATYADLAITATPLGGHTGDLVVTLPAATAEVYVFDGVVT